MQKGINIGQGNYGNVYIAYSKTTNKKVAIKIITKKRLKKENS